MYSCMLEPCCFDYCSFMKKKLESIMPPALFFFSQDYLASWGSLGLHVNFRIDFSIPCKKCHWDFDRECTEFEDHFG